VLEEQRPEQRMIASEEYNWTDQHKGPDLMKTRQMIGVERKS